VDVDPKEYVDHSEQQNEYAERPDIFYSADCRQGSETASSSITRVEEFKDVSAGREAAGQPVAVEDIPINEDIPPPFYEPSRKNPWWPFPSEIDWTLSSFFHKAMSSQGDIREYFQSEVLMRTYAGHIRSYTDYASCINQIPYGISRGDEWYTEKIKISAPGYLTKSVEYKVIYRDVTACVRFLVGHRPFAKNMSWAPIRQYHGRNDVRAYNEMHTGEWWWRTQEKLDSGATVVPIILSSDKTLMTKLQGDQTAWPVYITIGNINRGLRRQQTVPSILLLGFLPVIKAVTKNSDNEMAYKIKAQVFHRAMRTILQRKFCATKTLRYILIRHNQH
jgi:hypothetical protein